MVKIVKMDKTTKIKNITIIGGTGNFGLWYARLLKSKNFNITITARNAEKGNRIAKNEGLTYSNTLEKSVKNADVVILSIPVSTTPKMIKKIIPLLKKGTLLVDFASVKHNVCTELSKHCNLDLELGSLHPMHGPRIRSLNQKILISIPIKTDKKYEQFLDIFRNEKAKIITSTANEHDQMTAIIQGLTHMIFIASACTFQEMSLDIERLKEFSTPVFEVFLSIMARVVIQNPEMYANIQSQNTHNSKTRELFIKNMGFLGKLADSKDTTNLKTNIASSAQSFKYPEEFLFESDKALAAINAEKQELSRLIGHKVALQNICSGKYHYGIVKEMDFDNIILEHNKTQTPMKIRNIRLLGKMEYTNWLNENVGKNYRDYSILVYEKCKPKIISNILEFAESIDSVKLIDEYNGPQIKKGKKSLTFRLGFFEDINSKKIDQSVKKTISGLGFSLR